MNKKSMSVAFLTVLTLIPFWHQKNLRLGQDSPLLSTDKPGVYLSFERDGERKSLYAGESNQGIWLRMHNNTKWAINFCTPGLYIPPKVGPFRLLDGRGVLALLEGVEISMCHGVDRVSRYESVNTKAGASRREKRATCSESEVGYDKGDVSSTAWLPPGKSVIFSVPREQLCSDFAVFIRFNYEWEYGERTFRSNEAEHRVYFRGLDLPEKLQR
ncbi:MAG: hypothetical protein ABR555_18805 [Pyrinomonadaceae bacterium]